MKRYSVYESLTSKKVLADVHAAVAAAAEESAGTVLEVMRMAAKDGVINRTDARNILNRLAQQYS